MDGVIDDPGNICLKVKPNEPVRLYTRDGVISIDLYSKQGIRITAPKSVRILRHKLAQETPAS
jgi:hypothetical protein